MNVMQIKNAMLEMSQTELGQIIHYANSIKSISANATFSVSTVLTAMVGTHVLIGIGEALITGLTVSAVLASRSDLVYGWKGNATVLEIRRG